MSQEHVERLQQQNLESNRLMGEGHRAAIQENKISQDILAGCLYVVSSVKCVPLSRQVLIKGVRLGPWALKASLPDEFFNMLI